MIQPALIVPQRQLGPYAKQMRIPWAGWRLEFRRVVRGATAWRKGARWSHPVQGVTCACIYPLSISLYLCVCIYLYVYVYMCVCGCGCARGGGARRSHPVQGVTLSISISISIYVHICIDIYVYLCLYIWSICIYVSLYIWSIYTYIYIYIYQWTDLNSDEWFVARLLGERQQDVASQFKVIYICVCYYICIHIYRYLYL